MSNYYKPTARNVLRLWRWATGKPDARRVPIDWMTAFTQVEALRFLRDRLHSRINAGCSILDKRVPGPVGRHYDADFQLRLWRDGQTAKGETKWRLNPTRRWQTDYVHKRLGD